MSGMPSGDIDIPTIDGAIPGYRAMPDAGGPFPVVLVLQEIFGVNEHMRDICHRFAKLGYMAVSPELFIRQGDVSKMQDHQEIISKVVSKVPDQQVMSDLDAAVEWATGSADTSRLGVVGFCWGGRAVWLYAAYSAKLKAGCAFYGKLLGAAPELKAPVLGFYGGKDKSIPIEHVHQMQQALLQAGKDSNIMVYPDAGHGFFADYRPSYREPDAKDAWGHLLEWFRTHGVA